MPSLFRIYDHQLEIDLIFSLYFHNIKTKHGIRCYWVARPMLLAAVYNILLHLLLNQAFPHSHTHLIQFLHVPDNLFGIFHLQNCSSDHHALFFVLRETKEKTSERLDAWDIFTSICLKNLRIISHFPSFLIMCLNHQKKL